MGRAAVRVGLIGCGVISGFHARNITERSDAVVIGLADVNADNIAALKERVPALAGAASYADYRELLATDVDAVVIMTPHGLHYSQIREALEAGKHVLTEKPFVTQPEQARELIDLARERGRILMVSYQHARMWPYRYTRQQIAEGRLGELVFYSSQITQHWGRVGGWRRSPTLGEGGILVDTGSHFVDLMLYLTGMRPETVCAFSESDRTAPGLDTDARNSTPEGAAIDMVNGAIIRFDGGRVATLAVVGRGPTLWNITIVGTKGTIEITDRDNIRHIGAEDYPGWIGTERRNLVPPEGRRPETTTPDAEFIDAVRRGDLTTSDAVRGLVVAQLTQAILASAREGGMPVEVGALG